MKSTYLFLALAVSPFIGERLQAQSALQRSLQSADYKAEINFTTSSHQTPLWISANRHGLSSVEGDYGYLRLGLKHDSRTDSLRNWRIGYGADFAVAKNFTSDFIVQQLYADFDYKHVRLTIGSKEYASELKHPLLSSGSQTFGTNARPIPQIRIETPNYIRVFKNNDWIKIKGHFSYGLLTDGKFLQHYSETANTWYTKGAVYHGKAGYLRLGDERKFPLVFEGGLEMATIFGGTIYDQFDNVLFVQPKGLGDAVRAIYGGGRDETDGAYDNVAGNMLGSWVFSLSYHAKDWKVRAYFDHFFEDHSQLFLQYGWKDGLIGLEVTPPKNPFVDAVVYEYITTKDQTGSILHNKTPQLPYQISGGDDYYNHGLYPGWQHWGQAIGNPLYYSPLYDNALKFNNRFQGHHFGIAGKPTNNLSYRILFSHTKNWGSYANLFPDPKYKNSLLTEVSYRFSNPASKLYGWNATVGLGNDGGNHHQRSFGVSITIGKTGILF